MNTSLQDIYSSVPPLPKLDSCVTCGGCSGGGCSGGCCSTKGGGCGCSSGGGCCSTKGFKQGGCCSDNTFVAHGAASSDKPLTAYDYLASIPGNNDETDYVEVQFKNTRKGYYRNENGLPLAKGDVVAVESSPGHDIGTVTMTGRLVLLQMKKHANKRDEVRRIYRLAKEADIEKYHEAKAREQATMIRTRQIALELGLDMKISDVEYQGDGNKAIFYYIADGRVDFRQLIKVLADTFRIRVEMKQIGVRQEAGRVGGIGPCGRELCCTKSMTNFSSVSTNAARIQDVSLNPQRLAGQCGKLKCCLNYEVDVYMEAGRQLPPREVPLETADSTYYTFKVDILSGAITYSTDKRMAANLETISAERAKEIIALNKQGERPLRLSDGEPEAPAPSLDLVEQESLTRFDNSKGKRRKNGRSNANRQPQGERGTERQARGGHEGKDQRHQRPSRQGKPKHNTPKSDA